MANETNKNNNQDVKQMKAEVPSPESPASQSSSINKGNGENKPKKPSGKKKPGKPGAGDGKTGESKAEMKGKIYNDPSWRILNAVLGDQVNSFALDHIAGTKLQLGNIAAVTKQIVPIYDIATIKLNPSMGYSIDRFSAINQAALKLYTQISAFNNRTTKYQPNDIALLIGAVGEIISIGAFVRRAIGIVGSSSPTNYAYPRAVIEAMGINFADFVRNLTNYRVRYNIIASRASAIAFPGDLKYFKTCKALYENLFFDHSTTKAQTIITVPGTTWEYLDTASETGGMLNTKVFHSVDKPAFSQYLDILEEMVTNLLNTSLMQYVYKDVLTLYSGNMSKMFTLDLCPNDYVVQPVYSEEFMVSFENAVVLPEMGSIANTQKMYLADMDNIVVGTPQNNVYSNPDGTILYAPYISVSEYLRIHTNAVKDITCFCDQMVNFHVDQPSSLLRVIATRFMNAPSIMRVKPDGQTTQTDIVTYILTDHYITDILYTNSAADEYHSEEWILNNQVGSLTAYAHPRRILLGSCTDGVSDATISSLLCELDVPTRIPYQTLSTMNEVVIQSLFEF